MRSNCMSDLEIDAFLRRELEAARLLQFADHIGECETCRDKLAQRQNLGATKTSVEQDLQRFADHISEKELQQYVTGKLGLARIAEIDRHLVRCAQCAEEVRNLRNFVTSLPSASRSQFRRPLVYISATVMIAAVVIASFWTWRGREVLALNDAGGRIILDQRGKLKGVDSLTGAQLEIVQQALSQQKISVPAGLFDLTGKSDVLMGTTEQTRFRVTTPVGTFVNSLRPTLSWTSDPQSAGYTVTIYDESTKKNITSPLLQTTEWIVSSDLERGHTYVWQVVSLRKQGGEIIAPSPPSVPAKFSVLDKETASELQQLPPSHLVRGILYAHVGLLDDAKQELRTLQQENPESKIVLRLLQQLETQGLDR